MTVKENIRTLNCLPRSEIQTSSSNETFLWVNREWVANRIYLTESIQDFSIGTYLTRKEMFLLRDISLQRNIYIFQINVQNIHVPCIMHR